MMTALLLCALLQGPADRLAEAIKEVDVAAAREALAAVAAGDASRAARTLIVSLPRCRDRIAHLHSAIVGARQAITRIETGHTLTAGEEEIKKQQLEAAQENLKRANRTAVDGELIYDAVRDTFARLKAESVPAIADELATSNSWQLKCELYEGLARMKQPEPAAALLSKEKEPVVLAAALRTGEFGGAVDHLEHPCWQVKMAAARSSRGAREAAGPLVALMRASDGRLRATVFESLVALTKTNLGADPGPWEDWWKANREDWEACRYRPAAPKKTNGPGRTSFYEIPLVSTRICFLIDRSRSMSAEGRFDAAKTELKRHMRELPDGARVNVLFFGETVSSFATGHATRVLDKSSRRDAERWIDGMGYEEGTNLLLGLDKALALVGNPDTGKLREDGPDTIVVLSDGEPTVGRLVDDELVARVAARRARWLRPAVHSVTLGSGSRSLPLLSQLTGGETRTR